MGAGQREEPEPGGWVAARPKGMNETAGLGCLVGGGNTARQRNEPTVLPNGPSNNA